MAGFAPSKRKSSAKRGVNISCPIALYEKLEREGKRHDLKVAEIALQAVEFAMSEIVEDGDDDNGADADNSDGYN